MLVKASNAVSNLIWVVFIGVLSIMTVIANIRLFENILQQRLTGTRMVVIAAILCCGLIVLFLFRRRLYAVFQHHLLPWIGRNIYFLLFAVIVLSLGLRIVWVYQFPILGFEDDYAAYHDRASNYALGNYPPDDFVGLFPHVFGFSYVLGFVYKLLGSSIMTAAVFNIFLFVCSVVLLMLLFPPRQYPIRSLILVAVFAFWPAFIYYILVPNTECLFIALWLLILYIQKLVVHSSSVIQEIGLAVLLGGLLAGNNFIRPISNILIIAFILSLILIMIRKHICRKLLIIAVMIGCYYVCTLFINQGISAKAHIQTATLPIGFAFYAGMNPNPMGEEMGLWNLEDAGKFSDMVAQYKDTQLAQNAALQAGYTRLQNIVHDHQLLHFFYLKIRTAWGTDHWAIRYAAYQIETHPLHPEEWDQLQKIYSPLIAAGDVIYTAFLILVTLMVGYHFVKYRRTIGRFISFNCALLVIGTFLMLLFVESDPRYHLPGLLALMVIAVELIGSQANGKSVDGQE
jgi:hypothetical protein